MERRAVRVRGIVQGVGFRPFVAIGAKKYGLGGFVYNDSDGVYIEIEGSATNIERFLAYLQGEYPPMAVLEQVEVEVLQSYGESDFRIVPSPRGEERNTLIAADMAPCDDCLAEMRNPHNERYQYGFTNCTNCGPRYTIVQDVPYDRAYTTMSEFQMCPSCQAEYDNYENRRYHAQPNACPVCGPSYILTDAQGHCLGVEACLELLGASERAAILQQDLAEGRNWSAALLCGAALIRAGYIVALKGVGGYHLVCDAYNQEAVMRLRQRKNRPHKPFALMAGSLATIMSVAEVSEAERELLQTPARPIVLLTRKKEAALASGVAPQNHSLGIMLPYAPMHEVLLTDTDLWVMTSGNRSGDPVLFDDAQVLRELSGIADFFLVHNRRIEAPVDDSVLAVVDEAPLFYRRSRGYVPKPIYLEALADLPKEVCSLLATGSDMKNAFALTKGSHVFLGPHIGDLARQSTNDTFVWTQKHYETLFAVSPSHVVVDGHPNYYSSRYAKELGLPLITVQHHHAHITAVMAEYGVTEPVLGIALDGTGYGSDGHSWGGEFLAASATDYERLAHFSYAPLPGGEAVVKEPWRQALWYLQAIYGMRAPDLFALWYAQLPQGHGLLVKAIEQGIPMMQSSGAGRLFDAVGCLLGLGYTHTFDSQIALSLEQLAEGEEGRVYDFAYKDGILDFMPLVEGILADLLKGESRSSLAASFHKTVATAVASTGRQLTQEHGLTKVVLSGGVWQNRRLYAEICHAWPEQEFYLPRLVPPNDGGLALGQIWIAAHRLLKK